MGLFGKKKVKAKNKPETDEAQEVFIDDNYVPEDAFKEDGEKLVRKLRVLFPKQMLVGFYYAEYQEGGYIDDFACYTEDGRFMDKEDIPELCGLSIVDLISRQDALEKAFMDFRQSSEDFSGKPCNGVSLTLLNNGQVKIDVITKDLVEGEENQRYANWKAYVEKYDPKNMPKTIAEDKVRAIQEKSAPLYEDLGSEFFTFIPDEEFKKAYFYCESDGTNVFYYYRLILNDGEILDNKEMLERYDVEADEANEACITIVKLIRQIQDIFIENGEPAFTAITLSVTAKGEFESQIAFDKLQPDKEAERLAEWKETFKE